MIPPLKSLPFSVRFIFILVMFTMVLFISTYLAVLVFHFLLGEQNIAPVLEGTFTSQADKNFFLVVQGFVSLASFGFTAILFSYLESGEFSRHLRLNRFPKLKMVVLAVFSILIAQFFIDFLVKINTDIPLPSWLGFLKDLQDKNDKLLNNLMNSAGFVRFTGVSMVLAVIPAIVEEMFFRGLLLGDMLKARTQPAAAIVFTGLIFAVFHFEFQNTIAIWALGCFLGYLYYVSGSLWLSISVHFVNNFLEVLLKYLYNNKVITSDLSNTSTPIYITIIAITIFIGCLFLFNKWKQPYDENDEMLQYEEINP